MSDTKKRLKEALYYAKKGWPVIPLHTPGNNGCSCGNYDCRSGGKHPRTKHGAKDGTTDKEIIREWWQKWPDANIGIATGRASGLVVVDIDPRHGGDQNYDDLVDGHEKIDTLEVITGSGGRHIYFAYPHDRHIGCPGTDLSGIDIRGDGGLVVAPLSKHRNGRNYQWEESSKPTQIEVASMPQWMMDVLLPIEKEDKSKIADPLPDIIPEGERHTRMVSMAGSMRHRGVTAVEMLEAIRVLNQSRCKPPLPE